MMAWLQNYMIVLETLFGKRCPLLKTYKRIRVTLINNNNNNNNQNIIQEPPETPEPPPPKPESSPPVSFSS